MPENQSEACAARDGWVNLHRPGVQIPATGNACILPMSLPHRRAFAATSG